jgi:hypothetical protein
VVVTVASSLCSATIRGVAAALGRVGGERGDGAEDRRLVGVLLQAGGLAPVVFDEQQGEG